ncbi:MAG TPA: 3'-5' exonuclease [Spirochaetota bacterium]|nr:3'-5' exonuclease [Spirochaetota bacterium]HOL55967.1 3'-5' exonuclease [Spirochaetota bacterium]HPP03581.1 3'-5' exonuclease [Spirochaetota bacterium]
MGVFSIFSQNIVNNEYVFFDVETTGFYPFCGDRIIEIAMIKVRNGNIIDRLEMLLNPEMPIPEEAKSIHNIDDEILKDKPIFSSDIAKRLLDFIGKAILVAHNASFDIGFLSMEMARLGFIYEDWKAIDTLKMARSAFPYEKRHNLESMVKRYNLEIDNEFHRAGFDTEQLMKVFFSLIDEEEFRNKNIDTLIKKYGFCGAGIYKFISAVIREAIIEKREISGRYKKRDGEIVDISVIPKAPVWANDKWFLLANYTDSGKEVVLYCQNFIELR